MRCRNLIAAAGGAVIACLVAGGASAIAATCDLSGSWRSTIGVLALEQRSPTLPIGTAVTLAPPLAPLTGSAPEAVIVGTFDSRDGLARIEGAITGAQVALRFMKPPTFSGANRGDIVGAISADCGQIDGLMTPTGQRSEAWVARRVAVAPATTGGLYPTQSDMLDRALADLTAARGNLARPEFDVAVFARATGPDLATIFVAIHDTISPGLYEGALRGGRGALMAHEASSADRALLAAEVLAINGYVVRYARARLDDAVAARIVAAATAANPQLGKATPEPAFDPGVFTRAGINPADIAAGTKASADMGARFDRVLTTAGTDRGAIVAAIEPVLRGAGAAGLMDRQALRRAWLERVRDHVWVQVQRAGQWVDFDPTPLPEARLGTRLAEPRDVADTLPDTLFHRVGFVVEIERTVGARLETQVVGNWQIRTADVARLGLPMFTLSLAPSSGVDGAATIDLANPGVWFAGLAKDMAAKAVEFTPRLSLSSGEARTGTTFDLKGNLLADDPEARLAQRFAAPTGDALNRTANVLNNLLGGGSPAPAPPQSTLAAVWVDVKLSGPGLTERHYRRPLVDRIGAANRAAGNGALAAGAPGDDAVRQALASTYDIWVVPGPTHPDLVTERMIDAFLSSEGLLRKFLVARAGGEALRSSDLAAINRFSAELGTFRRAHDALLATLRAPAGLRTLQPVAHLIGVRTNTRTDSSGVSSGFLFDIMEASLEVLDLPGRQVTSDEALRFQLDLGVGLTLIEARLAEAVVRPLCENCEPPVRNAALATLPRTGAPAPPPLRLVRDRATLPAAITDRDDAAAAGAMLAAGRWIVVVPDTATHGAQNWWRFDPATGSILGVFPTGEGATFVEYLKRLAATYPSAGAVIGFYAGWAGCTGAWGNPSGLSGSRIAACAGCGILGAIAGYSAFSALGAATATEIGSIAAQRALQSEAAATVAANVQTAAVAAGTLTDAIAAEAVTARVVASADKAALAALLASSRAGTVGAAGSFLGGALICTVGAQNFL